MTKHSFEAETGKILELLTHSIYSNKEIFLRELISNSSDAIDKARIKSLTDTKYLGDDNKFEIKISLDKDKNLIYLEDNGIGMTEEELHDNIGTIAKSGTKEFLEKLKKAKEDGENNLIGQFGVGFYSAFMVADKVELETKSISSPKSHKWTSDGKSNYEIAEGKRKRRGTLVTLHINEANKELIEEFKIKELIKKYSNYLAVPIMLEEEKKDDKGTVTGKEYSQVNETRPIWQKSKTSVKQEEYDEFYKTVSMDYNKPLAHIHNNVEGAVSYKSLLYIPLEANMFSDMRDPNKEYGPKLYVKNVLILENAKELLPVWLRFVSGVVETSDLPLNVSRELLQSNAVLDKIKNSLIKKVVAELKKTMKKSPENYEKFLMTFGQVLKEGIHYEGAMKEEIAGVVKFKSMLGSKLVSLEDYLSVAPENECSKDGDKKKEGCCDGKGGCGKGEGGCCEDKKDDCCGGGGCCKDEKDDCCSDKEGKSIYYIVGKTEGEVLASPYLEQFRKNNVDVLLLTDPIDSFIVQSMTEYKGNKLIAITSSEVKLGNETEAEKKKKEKTKKEYKDLLELVKNSIGDDKLENVELNDNLGSALGALKTPDSGMDPQMEKMMRSMGQQVPAQKRILELNSNNALMAAMQAEFVGDVKSEKLQDLIKYAYNQAVLLEGGELENISEFVELTNKFAGKYVG